jgi:hypothetical protein
MEQTAKPAQAPAPQMATAQPVEPAPAPPTGMEHILYFPEQLIFWNVAAGSKRTAAIHLRQNDEHLFNVESIESTSEYVKAKLANTGGEDRRVFTIDINLSSGAPPGIQQGMVSIKTDHPDKPSISVPISWNVLDGVTVDPPAFGLRLTHSRRKAGGVIAFSSTAKQNFEIVNVESQLPGLITDIKPMNDCCGYYIAVLVDDGEFNIRHSAQSSLIIHTTLAGQNKIIVPVTITAPILAPVADDTEGAAAP